MKDWLTRQTAVSPAVQIKEKSFFAAHAQKFPGNIPDIFLAGNFMIGQIDAQKAADD